MKKIGFSLFLFTLVFFSRASAETDKLKVVTTLFPTYDFVRQIGGDLLEVTLLLPPGVESHSFAPTPWDMVTINRAAVFVFTGEDMEPWVGDLLDGVDNKKLLVVDAGLGIKFLVEKNYHHGKHDGIKDPHIWLDPIKAEKMVRTIGEALAQADPANQEVYLEKTDNYIAKLMILDRDIRRSLAKCRLNTIISGGHFAFGSFAKRYNIKAVSAYKGFSPNAKPGPKGIVELVKTMKKVGSKVVYHEELIDPKVARIVAEETGAVLRLLHGAHNVSLQERRQGVTYISIMRQNLAYLREGLQCQ